MTSYSYIKAMINALKHLAHGICPRIMHGGSGRNAGKNRFFVALYCQLLGKSMESARFTVFIKKKKKSPKVKALLQHQLTCSSICCGPICRPCCGKWQTSKPHLTSQPVSHSLARRSRMAFQLLLLLRLT